MFFLFLFKTSDAQQALGRVQSFVIDAKSLQKEEGKKKEKYFKLKEWDSLRKDIADVIELEGENDDIVEKVIEIAERHLNSEIPALIKAFNKIKRNCSIIYATRASICMTLVL